MKILVVDHDPTDIQLLKRLLKMAELTACQKVEELPKEGYDLIILNLETASAQTVLHALELPLLLIGNEADDHPKVLEAIAQGAQDYLNKKELTEASLEKSIAYSCHRQAICKKLKDLSLTDELTGLYNRRGFTQLLEHQISFASRHSQPFLLITIDVNFFKEINDKFGHPTGDQALRDIAATLKKSFRQHDFIARTGGDEFAVIARETTTSEPLIHHLLEGLSELEERPYTLAVSVGESLFDPKHPLSSAELIAEADQKLYCSKRQSHTIHQPSLDP